MSAKKKLNREPFISICTPTFNRRPFIPLIIKCIEHQTYPKNKIEWILIDDGTDKIEDLVKDLPYVKYFKYDERISLGKKRNMMHEKSKGEIIVYMDDDDYYPPERVAHCVKMLNKSPRKLIAGSSEMFIYFKHIDKILKFGPYGNNHSTAATFAFRKNLLKKTQYDEDALFAEEKQFLKDYKIPLIQMDSKKTILVISHIHNTYDKKKMLEKQTDTIKYTDKTLSEFIPDDNLRNAYMNIDNLLVDYEPGRPENKPETMIKIKEREAMIQKMEHDMMMEYISKMQQKEALEKE